MNVFNKPLQLAQLFFYMFDPYHYYKRKTKSSRKGQVLQKKINLTSGDSHAITTAELKYWGNILSSSNNFVQSVMNKKIRINTNTFTTTVRLTARPIIEVPEDGQLNTVSFWTNIVKNMPDLPEIDFQQAGNLIQKIKSIIGQSIEAVKTVREIWVMLRNAFTGFADNNYLGYVGPDQHNVLGFNQVHRALIYEPSPTPTPTPQNRQLLDDDSITTLGFDYDYVTNPQSSTLPWGTAQQYFYRNYLDIYNMEGDTTSVTNTGLVPYIDQITVLNHPTFSLHVSQENIESFLSENFPNPEDDFIFSQLYIDSGDGFPNPDLRIVYFYVFDIAISSYQIIN